MDDLPDHMWDTENALFYNQLAAYPDTAFPEGATDTAFLSDGKQKIYVVLEHGYNARHAHQRWNAPIVDRTLVELLEWKYWRNATDE
jgi:hypothetical protein